MIVFFAAAGQAVHGGFRGVPAEPATDERLYCFPADVGIRDGSAWLNRMLGNSRHDGFVAESITLNVIPVQRAGSVVEVLVTMG